MKCPHCHRIWETADIDAPLSPTLVLEEHVRRFCPGEPPARPAGAATVRAHRARRLAPAP
jgi:hypothetical protein